MTLTPTTPRQIKRGVTIVDLKEAVRAESGTVIERRGTVEIFLLSPGRGASGGANG